jgi:hypothetical protein
MMPDFDITPYTVLDCLHQKEAPQNGAQIKARKHQDGALCPV